MVARIDCAKTARSNVMACCRMISGSKRISPCARDARGKGGRRGLVDEDAGDAVEDRLDRAAAAQRDDRRPARLRFDRHDAEILLAGKEHGRRASILVVYGLVGQRAEKLHVGSRARGEIHQRAALGSVADDAKWHVGEMAGLDGHVDALIRNESRHNQQRVFASDRVIRDEKARIDGRIDDVGVTIIVPTDPAGNVLRDGDIVVDPAGRGGIPARQRVEHGLQGPVFQGPDPPFAEVRVELVPRIPHRRKAVTQVPRPACLDDGLRGTVAGADDEVVLDRDRTVRSRLGRAGGNSDKNAWPPAASAAPMCADAAAR